jgi:hypothetical protein
MTSGISDKTTIRLPMALFLSILVGLVTGTITAYSGYVSGRAAIITETDQRREQELRHYLSIEGFDTRWQAFMGEWAREQRQQDREWQKLEDAIGGLESRVQTRR